MCVLCTYKCMWACQHNTTHRDMTVCTSQQYTHSPITNQVKVGTSGSLTLPRSPTVCTDACSLQGANHRTLGVPETK